MSRFNEKEGYMCLTDYEWHLEGDANGTTIYPSLTALQNARKCVKEGGECGIVKVKIQITQVVRDEDF